MRESNGAKYFWRYRKLMETFLSQIASMKNKLRSSLIYEVLSEKRGEEWRKRDKSFVNEFSTRNLSFFTFHFTKLGAIEKFF